MAEEERELRPAAEPTVQPETTARRRGRGRLSSVQVMFAAILAIGLLLAFTYSSRIAAGQPLEKFSQQVLAEIDQLKQEQAALVAERDYAMSDAYVEAWARDEGKMVKPGEVLVIPVPSGATVQNDVPTPPAVAIETSPPEPEPWTLWWSLFFDSPPPS